MRCVSGVSSYLYMPPTTLTTFLKSNLIAAPSNPARAQTSLSRLRRAPIPAFANSPLTFTSTQRDVRTSCLARPGPRRTASSSSLRAHFARQDVAKRGCRLLHARFRLLLACQHVHSRKSRAAHGRTIPPRRAQPRPPCLRRPRPRLGRQRTPIWTLKSLTALV